MTMRRDPLLDDEERQLADQLARIAPHGEPSADMDARILAMAERGLAGAVPASALRRRPHRWPVWLGAAASLSVVAGLVWQLQPVLYPRDTISYEAPASVAADNDPNGKRHPIDYVESAVSDAAMPPPPPPSKPQTQTRRAPPPAAEPVPAVEPIANSAPPPPPAPPAPPSAPAPVVDNSAAQADAAATKMLAADRAMAQEAPRRPAPIQVEAAPVPVASSRTRQAVTNDADAAAESREVEATLPPPDDERAGFDARPPLTADTPDVQRNWLARIRELRDAGNIDEARQSLAAFAQRNPKAEIPADLKPLLPAKAPPSTEP